MELSFGNCALGCGFGILEGGLCGSCRERLEHELDRFASLRRCEICGAPMLFGDAACAHHGPAWYIDRIGSYRSTLRHVLLAYKKGGDRRLAPVIANLVHDRLSRAWDFLPSSTILVPVPCILASRRRRGWDQMELMVHNLVQTHGYRMARLFVRTGTGEQKALPRQRRIGEASHNYRLAEGPPELYAPRTVIVVDDVMTTGASLRTCLDLASHVFPCKVQGLCVAMH